MKITTYEELQSRNGLLPLFQHAFWWPFNPKEFERTINADARLQDGPVGYVAMENNLVVGFVGVMNIATRTLQGSEEEVGGIWGVVTHPSYSRKGISTALMQESHEYFREKGHKFALLNTSKSLIAYSYYRKLGYGDVIAYASAYKVIKDAGKKASKKISRKNRPDWNKILKIYDQIMESRSGFVIRDMQYLKMLEVRKRIQPEKLIVSEEGYALLKEDEGNVAVQEIVALTNEEADKLITQIEGKATKTIIADAVLDNNLQRAYLSHGFLILENSYDVLMCKSLAKASFKEIYGDEFYVAATDYF